MFVLCVCKHQKRECGSAFVCLCPLCLLSVDTPTCICASAMLQTIHCCAQTITPHPQKQRPITVNFGMSMPGWYDISSLEDINQREDKEGLHESQRYEGGGRVREERVCVYLDTYVHIWKMVTRGQGLQGRGRMFFCALAGRYLSPLPAHIQLAHMQSTPHNITHAHTTKFHQPQNQSPTPPGTLRA